MNWLSRNVVNDEGNVIRVDGKYVKWGTTAEGNATEQGWEEFLAGAGPEPLIAEPSFLKHEVIRGSSGLLREEWREFDRRLAAADIVLVVGYSMPDGDALAKHSLLTAVKRNAKAKYVVVDPDKSGQVQERYRRILGPDRLTFIRSGLSEFLSNPMLLQCLTNP